MSVLPSLMAIFKPLGGAPPPPSGLGKQLRGTGFLKATVTLGVPVGITLPNVTSGTLLAFYDFTHASFETGRAADALTVLDRGTNGYHITLDDAAAYVPTEDLTAIGGGRRSLVWNTATGNLPLRNIVFSNTIATNATGFTEVTAVRWENVGNNINPGSLGRAQRNGDTGTFNRTGLVVGYSAGLNVTGTWAGSSQSSAATQNNVGTGTHVLSTRTGKGVASELRTNGTITTAGSTTTQNISTTGGLNIVLGGAWRNTGSVTPRQYLVASAIFAGRLSDGDLAAVRGVMATAANVTITV
jgi:hypothetical protein